MSNQRTHIHLIKPGGVTIRYERRGQSRKFTKIVNNDSIEIDDTEHGIYLTVRTHRGEIYCVERLYGMDRKSTDFWVLSRDWGGRDHKKDTKYKRDAQYPVGKQVRLKCSKAVNRKSSQSVNTASNSSTTQSVGSSTASV